MKMKRKRKWKLISISSLLSKMLILVMIKMLLTIDYQMNKEVIAKPNLIEKLQKQDDE